MDTVRLWVLLITAPRTEFKMENRGPSMQPPDMPMLQGLQGELAKETHTKGK